MILNQGLLSLLLVLGISGSLRASYCEGDGWVAFKDEKCFKVIEQFTPRNQAVDLCEAEWNISSEVQVPSLAFIESADEQAFLEEVIYQTAGIEVNVWIGATRRSNTSFAWDDGSSLSYANWLNPEGPSNLTGRGCAEMVSSLTRTLPSNGKWRDVTCKSANYVLCQKYTQWSDGQQQAAILALRRQLKSVEEIVEEKAFTSFPIGFIYVQLPEQSGPESLVPGSQWEDISATYGGVFFRVEGGSSGDFGSTQQENAPHLSSSTFIGGSNSAHQTSFTPGSCSRVHIGGYETTGNSLNFCLSGGEVRPRNMAVRIWKRIA